jgi:hypothetical protein
MNTKETTNDVPRQLSFDGLDRMAGYEVPKRQSYIIYNRRTHEIAIVVSSSEIVACLWLKWDIKDCDTSPHDLRRASYGIVARSYLPLRSDIVDAFKAEISSEEL